MADEVRDDGQGIPDSGKAACSEPFYRGDTSRGLNDIASFGLGLSIAQSIAGIPRRNPLSFWMLSRKAAGAANPGKTIVLNAGFCLPIVRGTNVEGSKLGHRRYRTLVLYLRTFSCNGTTKFDRGHDDARNN